VKGAVLFNELRVVLTVVLVPIAAFCCFGFLDSAEAGPSGAIAYRWLYGTGILACLAAVVAVWVVKRK
jgi:hypothetical protein